MVPNILLADPAMAARLWGCSVKLALFMICGALAFAQDAKVKAPPAEIPAVKTPKPIPAERHEEISRKMLPALSLESQALRAQAAADQAKAQAEGAMREYQDLLGKLQKEFEAPGCELTLDKTWACKKEPAK